MNVATLLRHRRPRIVRVLPRVEPTAAPASIPGIRRSRRARARNAVALAFAFTLLAFLGFDFVLDYASPQVRDPEFGRRESRYHARVAENPTRPVVAVFGSSRVSMGLRPAAWEEVRPEGNVAPIFCNLSIVGGGPVMQMMCLKRLLQSGTIPDAVLFEYWPPFLRGDKQFAEEGRIDVLRLGPEDREFVKQYYREPERTFETMTTARLNPFYEYRHRLMAQINPRFLKWNQRLDVAWDNLDPWGWLPGVPDDPAGSENRMLRMKQCWPFYRDQFEGFSIDPLSDRAFRDLVETARNHGIKVGFVFLPESAEFRAWYPPEVERATQEHFAKLCKEMNVPAIEARLWLGNDATCDGFHLFRGMAGKFTQQLGPAVMAAFPDLKKRGVP